MTLMQHALVLMLVLINGVLGAESKFAREVLSSCPSTVGPITPGVRVANTTYISGNTGNDAVIESLVPGGIGPETRQALIGVTRLLSVNSLTTKDVVQVRVFLTDMNDYDGMNEAYSETFEDNYPARSVFQVKEVLDGSRVMIEAIAVQWNSTKQNDFTQTIAATTAWGAVP